jgi:hypothetical protein
MVDASWWNTIRTALVSFVGAAQIDETQFTIGDGSSSYTSISALALDASVTRAHAYAYTIYRDSGATSRREMGIIRGLYKAREGTWDYAHESWGDDALGNGTVAAPLIINASGAFQYKSDTFAAGTIRVKTLVSFLKET